MTLVFRHPKYYKELRKRNKQAGLSVEVSKALCEISMTSNCLESDQAISGAEATAEVERATGPGLKHQASSSKLKETQASSDKPQAPSHKRQASSRKLQAHES